MAYAKTSGMNASLNEGMSDGKYKKITPNRGGVVEVGTYEDRRDLYDGYYGIHEKQVKVLPDGLMHATPMYEDNPTPQSMGDVIP